MVTKLRVFIVAGLLGLSACGIEVSGAVDVNLNIESIRQYFVEYCKDEYPDNEQLQKECVDYQVAQFLAILSGSQIK